MKVTNQMKYELYFYNYKMICFNFKEDIVFETLLQYLQQLLHILVRPFCYIEYFSFTNKSNGC
jgi:hypothetical protein